jgi:nucleoside 2-deoxyribosyltransferase
MAKVYVAGPMTGYPELNYPAFHAAAERLRKQGFEVVSPAELNPITEEYLPAMRNDIRALIECDHILMLQGWHASKGATPERHIASVLGIKEITLESKG